MLFPAWRADDDQRQPAHEMTERQEPLGGKIAIGELVAEEDPQERGDAERIADQRLLPRLEVEHPHVGQDLPQPRAQDAAGVRGLPTIPWGARAC